MRGAKADMPATLGNAGAVIQEAVWDDFHVSFDTFSEGFDTTPLHKGLPNDSCQCPHWGYVLKGRVRVVYADREELLRAGDAYYMEPGHNAIYQAGTETVEFSPNGPFQSSMEVAMRNVGAMQSK